MEDTVWYPQKRNELYNFISNQPSTQHLALRRYQQAADLFSLSLTRMLILYVPLAWIASTFIGLTGIFWSAFSANLIAGSLAWVWLNKVIDNKMEETSSTHKAEFIKGFKRTMPGIINSKSISH